VKRLHTSTDHLTGAMNKLSEQEENDGSYMPYRYMLSRLAMQTDEPSAMQRPYLAQAMQLMPNAHTPIMCLSSSVVTIIPHDLSLIHLSIKSFLLRVNIHILHIPVIRQLSIHALPIPIFVIIFLSFLHFDKLLAALWSFIYFIDSRGWIIKD